jgi:hypothetical protein
MIAIERMTCSPLKSLPFLENIPLMAHPDGIRCSPSFCTFIPPHTHLKALTKCKNTASRAPPTNRLNRKTCFMHLMNAFVHYAH